MEALVASAVLLAGLLGITALDAALRLGAQAHAERAQALRDARAHAESVRAEAVPPAAGPGQTQVARWSAEPLAGDPPWAATALDWEVHGDETAAGLAWTRLRADAAPPGRARQPVQLHSAQARASPAWSGALLAWPRGAAAASTAVMAGSVPADARPLGNGRSAWRPDPESPIEFVFDDATGRILARCGGADDPPACTPIDALLLTGWVRVSLAVPPDALDPADAPLPLALALRLDAGTLVPPGCASRTRDGALAYHCVIATQAGTWSGRSDILPSGWALGRAADALQVCRYTGSPAGPGGRNAAHPAHYDDVDRNLMQQNFLVIRGDQACPTVAAPDGADVVVTQPHQP